MLRTSRMLQSTLKVCLEHPIFTLSDAYISNALHTEARIPVPDVRFFWLCGLYKPASRIPAFLTCIDIAGLTAVSFSVAQTLNGSI